MTTKPKTFKETTEEAIKGLEDYLDSIVSHMPSMSTKMAEFFRAMKPFLDCWDEMFSFSSGDEVEHVGLAVLALKEKGLSEEAALEIALAVVKSRAKKRGPDYAAIMSSGISSILPLVQSYAAQRMAETYMPPPPPSRAPWDIPPDFHKEPPFDDEDKGGEEGSGH